MSTLFSYGDIKNRPARAGFDPSSKFCFTAKAGEILPVYWDLLLPGTKVNLKHLHLTRTMPVNTAAYVRIKEYFDWYFVPLRLINKNLPPALVQMQDNPVTASSVYQSRIPTLDLPYASSRSFYDKLKAVCLGSSDINKYDVNFLKRSAQSMKLLQYLRYGACLYSPSFNSAKSDLWYMGLQTSPETAPSEADDSLNLFYSGEDRNFHILPLFAYQKIYNDYFRFEQWESAEPFTYNCDYYTGGNVLTSVTSVDFWTSNNFLTLRYANYKKDLFMGMLPDSQLGEIATVDIDFSNASSSSFLGLSTESSSSPIYTGPDPFVAASVSGIEGRTISTSVNNTGNTLKQGLRLGVYASNLASQLTGTFDILALRTAEALQRYREIAQCADQNYLGQLKAHWGVNASKALSDVCQYIGGTDSDLDISEVVNQTLTGDDQAQIKGKGVGSSSGSETFECSEHGILMCVYHAVPQLDYRLQGQDLKLFATSVTDLPQPEFDNLGLEALPVQSLVSSFGTMIKTFMEKNPILGYVPRYVAYKTDVDRVSGAFLNTMKSWVAPLDIRMNILKLASINPSGDVKLSYAWFKVSPYVLDSIFVNQVDSTWDTDQFLVNAYFDVKKVQNLNYDGMPY